MYFILFDNGCPILVPCCEGYLIPWYCDYINSQQGKESLKRPKGKNQKPQIKEGEDTTMAYEIEQNEKSTKHYTEKDRATQAHKNRM